MMGGSIEEQNFGLTCLKYFVLGFNGIFMMTGCLMLSMGSAIFGVYNYFNTFLETWFFSPASVLIMIGGFLFLTALIGFIGVIRESTLIINTYSVLLCFVCLLQISAGVTAFAVRGRVEGAIYRNMNHTIKDYPFDLHASHAMDSLQKSLNCCGIYNPSDWKGVFPLDRLLHRDNILLPDSCCLDFIKTESDVMCLGTRLSGCLPRLKLLVCQTLRVVFGTSLILAIIQLTGITFTYRLARLLIKIKSKRLAQQIQLRNQAQNIYDVLGVVGTEWYADNLPSYDEIKHTFKT